MVEQVNPVLICNPANFAMLADQHYFPWWSFPTFVEQDIETGTNNHTIDATNDLSWIFRSRAYAALSQEYAILGMVLGLLWIEFVHCL